MNLQRPRFWIPRCHRWRGGRDGRERRRNGAKQEIPSHGNIYPLASCRNLDLEIYMMLMNISNRKAWSKQSDKTPYTLFRAGGNASASLNYCLSASTITSVPPFNRITSKSPNPISDPFYGSILNFYFCGSKQYHHKNEKKLDTCKIKIIILATK